LKRDNPDESAKLTKLAQIQKSAKRRRREIF
jgi:hypothetical protein